MLYLTLRIILFMEYGAQATSAYALLIRREDYRGLQSGVLSLERRGVLRLDSTVNQKADRGRYENRCKGV